MPRPATQDREPFLPARARLWIGSLDDSELEVQAQYNPKELLIDKTIPWQSHNERDNRATGRRKKKQQQKGKTPGQADFEFNGAPTRSMSLELLFDGYESNTSIEPKVQALEIMSSVMDTEDEDKKRPHHCVVAWGDQQTGMRPFRCIIESLQTKYTMWNRNGVPLRATCTVKLKEADFMGTLRAAETTSYNLRDHDQYRAHEDKQARDMEERKRKQRDAEQQLEQERAIALAKQQREKAARQAAERAAAAKKRLSSGGSPQK